MPIRSLLQMRLSGSLSRYWWTAIRTAIEINGREWRWMRNRRLAQSECPSADKMQLNLSDRPSWHNGLCRRAQATSADVIEPFLMNIYHLFYGRCQRWLQSRPFEKYLPSQIGCYSNLPKQILHLKTFLQIYTIFLNEAEIIWIPGKLVPLLNGLKNPAED